MISDLVEAGEQFFWLLVNSTTREKERSRIKESKGARVSREKKKKKRRKSSSCDRSTRDSMAGQTINDRLLAARHSIAGQGLAKAVCKATTEEMIGPKKKHLECKFSRLDSSVPLTYSPLESVLDSLIVS